jgi:glutamate N-acetyltransferase / amino-acid N-acetyltransferase
LARIALRKKGLRDPHYDEKTTSEYMKNEKIDICVNVGTGGKGRATVWTCDLTKEYVAINGDYRS